MELSRLVRSRLSNSHSSPHRSIEEYIIPGSAYFDGYVCEGSSSGIDEEADMRISIVARRERRARALRIGCLMPIFVEV